MLKMYRIFVLLFLILRKGGTHEDQSLGRPCSEREGGFCVNTEDCDDDNYITGDVKLFYDDTDNILCPYVMFCCVPRKVTKASKNTCGMLQRHRYSYDDETVDLHPKHVTWNVALMVPIAKENGLHRMLFLANAVLIHHQVVLTTARNVALKIKPKFGDDTIYAVVGDYDQRSIDTNRKAVQVESIMMHKNYDEAKGTCNAALVFLRHSASIHPGVVPVCLPQYARTHTFKHGTSCFFTGWGKDGRGLHQSILGLTKVPIVEKNNCTEWGRSGGYGAMFTVVTTIMCAGGEPNQDLCDAGDGGSALVCPMEGSKDQYILAGMLASLKGCGNLAIPGLFVDLSPLRNWIEHFINKKGFGALPSYT